MIVEVLFRVSVRNEGVVVEEGEDVFIEVWRNSDPNQIMYFYQLYNLLQMVAIGFTISFKVFLRNLEDAINNYLDLVHLNRLQLISA
jgi:hypothetical protein